MVALSLRERPLGFLAEADDFAPGTNGPFGLLGGRWPLMQTMAAVLTTSKSCFKRFNKFEVLIQQFGSWCPEAALPYLDERDTHNQTMVQIAKACKSCCVLTLLK